MMIALRRPHALAAHGFISMLISLKRAPDIPHAALQICGVADWPKPPFDKGCSLRGMDCACGECRMGDCHGRPCRAGQGLDSGAKLLGERLDDARAKPCFRLGKDTVWFSNAIVCD
jgi:hypothetical protein